MLSIGKLAAGNERYYLDSVADGQEDYYSGKGETPGTWEGTGAQQAKLSGEVKPGDFLTVVSGSTPSGKELRTGKNSPTQVNGYDLTFSAPKSVSLLYGLGDPDVSRTARDAHDFAVREALGYLEREACAVRRGHAGAQVLPASGFIAAAFRHRSSRSGDPQLHTHTVIANAGHADNRWTALDGRLLYAHARTAGYLYQATLRDQLTRGLGVDWLAVENGMAEIRGIPEEVLRHFSQRSFELEQHLNELGRSSRKSREIAALETRKRKDYDVSPTRLRDGWQQRATALGFDRAAIARLLGRPVPDQTPQMAADAAERMTAPHGLTKQASTFDRRDAIRDWAAHHRRGASVADVERLTDAWLTTPDVVPLADGAGLGGRRYSTREMLQTENDLIENCQRRRAASVARARSEDVEQALRDRPTVTREQAVVVRSLTLSGDGVQVLRAAAGTGKTFALDAAREAWEAGGVRVVGCALSARAAVELQSQSGIRSDTVASLQRSLPRGEGVPRGGVLVVDEAGMVGTRHLAQLAAATEKANAKLVLVGDDHQLPEIDAGGAFRGISRRIGALSLQKVMRQRSEWDRDALDHLRRGRVEDWVKDYRARGRVISHPTAEGTRQNLVRDWWVSAREPGTDAIMIAHRRADVADLNDRARSLMHQDRRLGDAEVSTHDRSFAAGDLVLAKRNDRRLHIVNGTRGRVVEVDPEQRAVTVDTVSGDRLVLPARYLDAGHLEHGYAMTAHAAQGATVDKAYVLGSDDLYREWGYTALSRHRHEARFYAVSVGQPEQTLPGLEPQPDPLLEDVVDSLRQTRHKDLAIDSRPVLNDPEQPAVDPFAEQRNREREQRRAAAAAERTAVRLREAERQRAELQAELEATPRLRVGARGELRAAIERRDELLERWRDELVASRVQRPSPDVIDHAPVQPVEQLTALAPSIGPDGAPTIDLDDGIDLGP